MKEREDRDRISFGVHAIEDNERCLGDPCLVDGALFDMLSSVWVVGKELEKKGVDASKRALGDVSSKMIDSSWLATSASTRAERTTFMSA